MSQNYLNNGSSAHRDYGATSSSSVNMRGGSSSNNIPSMPDVNFSGFSPTEFMSLSEDIAHNVQAVNSLSKQLEKILQILGSPRQHQSTRDKVHDIHTKANECIAATTVDLQRLTAVVNRGDKQQKLQLEKLANDFRIVVEKYSTIQKRIASTMRETLTRMHFAQLQEQQDPEADREDLLQRQQQMDQQQLQFEHDMLVDRERQIQQIEAQILDVNAIMNTISSVAHSQQEDVERIESHVENAATDVQLGREQLATAAGRRQSYRRKILILLVIAVIIGLIITGIIVSKLTS